MDHNAELNSKREGGASLASCLVDVTTEMRRMEENIYKAANYVTAWLGKLRPSLCKLLCVVTQSPFFLLQYFAIE